MTQRWTSTNRSRARPRGASSAGAAAPSARCRYVQARSPTCLTRLPPRAIADARPSPWTPRAEPLSRR
eukprot:scaffold631_cov378-Prasinococcus_capsulatus_cf.AAC.14